MKSKPFLIKIHGEESALDAVQSDAPIHSESWLQKIIQDHPQILPVDEIDPAFSDLISIGREISTPVGRIDNLLISKSGYLVVVETKLWKNSEAKREVMAQAIDYSSAIAQWSFKDLNDKIREVTGKNVIELITTSFDLDNDEIPSEDMIAKYLRLGRFLILIVGEKIRESLVDMLRFAELMPHLSTYIGLVELQCYKMPDNSEDIIVVPSIVARTEIIKRSVVEINILPSSMEHKIISVPEKADEDKKQGKTLLSEEAFWETLQRQAPDCVESARKIFDHMREIPEVVLKLRQNAIVTRLNIPDSDQRISVFFIDTTGKVECWSKTILGQVENAGIQRTIGEQYVEDVSKILKNRTKTLSNSYPANKIDLQKFLTVVDTFIDKAVNSDRAIEE